MSRIIGIDLGTSNSCLSYHDGKKVSLIPNSKGYFLTKSVVNIEASDCVRVGEEAERRLILNRSNSITGVKRLIGRQYNEVIDLIPLLPYQVIHGKNNFVSIIIDGVEYTPEQITSYIIGELKRSAEEYFESIITEAVITVPAYFNEIQRAATRDAVELAGLKVRRILHEPTAAAMAYRLNEKGDAKIAVFDLGGGTFDITILEIGDGVFEVLSVNGDGFVGGDDFDARIYDWIIEESRLSFGIKLDSDSEIHQMILAAAKSAKIELSSSIAYTIHLPYLKSEEGKPFSFSKTLTRQKFEEICQELFEKLEVPCHLALSDALIDPKDISDVILVGGATRMPYISKIIQKVFHQSPNKSVHPDQAVALGAGIQAGVLSGKVRDVLLLDVVPRPLGVEIENGCVEIMIDANTTIPTKKSQTFTTISSNQNSVEIHIVQGCGQHVLEFTSIGRFALVDIGHISEENPIPQIEVSFEVDANGLLRVMARDKYTGLEDELVVKATVNRNQD